MQTLLSRGLLLFLALLSFTAHSLSVPALKPIAVIPKVAAVSPTVISTSQKTNCDVNNRPTYMSCYNDTSIDVCAYYKDDCPFEVCGKPASNGCFACQDSTVLYYTPGTCKPSIVVQACPNPYFHLNYYSFEDPSIKQNNFVPVCGILKNCTKGSCSNAFDNQYKACGSQLYGWYQDGFCENQKHYCKASQRRASCSGTKASSVCAFFTDKDNITHYTTVTNGCLACQDPAVDHYRIGPCGNSTDNNTYCLPSKIPGTCTKQYNPVCGFYTAEDLTIQHKIFSNPCTACHSPAVTYYQPGPCIFWCQHSRLMMIKLIDTSVQPVCGSYEVNGTIQKRSVQNSNSACNDGAVYYTEGLCPGDGGLSCIPFRNQVVVDGGPEVINQTVCGYTRKGCTSSSCRQVYTSQNTACGNDSVLFFTIGSC